MTSPSNSPRLPRILIGTLISIVFIAIVLWFGWLLRVDDPARTIQIQRIVLVFTGCVCMFLFFVAATLLVKAFRHRSRR